MCVKTVPQRSYGGARSHENVYKYIFIHTNITHDVTFIYDVYKTDQFSVIKFKIAIFLV